MFCINCFHKNTAVVNSRPHKKQPLIWRRRKCSKCGTIFTTHERPSLADNKAIQLENGETDTFSLGRLTLSIAAAFPHAQKEARYNALWLAQSVEDVLSVEYPVVTLQDIEAVTHNVLKRYDELAALQYAAKHQLIIPTRRAGRPSLRERGPRR